MFINIFDTPIIYKQLNNFIQQMLWAVPFVIIVSIQVLLNKNMYNHEYLHEFIEVF